MNKRLLTNIFLVSTILTAIMIFCFSAQGKQASSRLSSSIAVTIVKMVRPDYPRLSEREQLSLLSNVESIIRKCAHFLEFSLLGFCLACYGYLQTKRKAAFPVAWILGTLYACTDELHQLFVPGREPGLLDICIDSAGAALGVVVVVMVTWKKNRELSN